MSEGDGGEQTAAYLSRILAELREREQRLAALEERIRLVEFELAGAGMERRLIRGDAAGMAGAEAFCRSRRQQLEALRRERAEAAADVERARERRAMVEAELKEQRDG